MKIRSYPADHFKLEIRYETEPIQTLSVGYWDAELNMFRHCFTVRTDLEFPGYFLFSGSAGFKNPDYHYIESFRLWDPKVEQLNNHFYESHTEKALHEKLADKLSEKIGDLIHTKAEQTHLADASP